MGLNRLHFDVSKSQMNIYSQGRYELCGRNCHYYLKRKKNAVDAQPAMQFAQKKQSLWRKMRKDLSILLLMQASVSDVTCV